MKKSMFALISIIIFVFPQLQAQTWSTLIRLTWNSGISERASITTDSSNRIHVVWQDDTPGNFEIYHKRSTLSGETKIGTKRLTWNAGISDYPVIAADSGNGIHIVWDDDTPGNSEIFYKRSFDNGVTWSGLMRLTWNVGDSFLSSIATDSGNGIHVVWSDLTSGYFEIFYKHSTDSGISWTGLKRLTWNTGWSSYPSITIDLSNVIHVVWSDNVQGNYEIYYKRSTDNGSTWSALKRMTWNSGSSILPHLAADSGNGIHLVWQDDTPGIDEIYYKHSTNSGISWPGYKRLTWKANYSYNPSLATDAINGIHIVWYEAGNEEIFYRHSTNSGVTWIMPKRLTWNTSASRNPSIAADSANDIHVVWQDSKPGNWEIFYKNRK